MQAPSRDRSTDSRATSGQPARASKPAMPGAPRGVLAGGKPSIVRPYRKAAVLSIYGGQFGGRLLELTALTADALPLGPGLRI